MFRELLQPELPFYNRQIVIGLRLRASVSVLLYGNSIALFHYVYQRGHFHIWVMKEYGVGSSWTKVFSFSETNATETIPRSICFRRNHEIVFEMNGREMDGGHLVLQNLETQEIKDLGIVGYKYAVADSYVENLVLLDKAANGAVAY